MTFASFDLYFHMANHYRKLKKVKAVVDCSSPKGYNKSTCTPKYTSQCNSSWLNTCTPRKPRSCSPSARASNCAKVDYHQRCFTEPGSPRKDWTVTRSRCRKNDDKVTKIPVGKSYDGSKMPIKSKQPAKKQKPKGTKDKRQDDSQQCPQECEYVHFLLQITEDILRNNLYTEKKMNKLFESYIQANKRRLDENRMRTQIQQLKKELNLPSTSDCVCDEEENKPSEKRKANISIKRNNLRRIIQEDCKGCPFDKLANSVLTIPEEVEICNENTCQSNIYDDYEKSLPSQQTDSVLKTSNSKKSYRSDDQLNACINSTVCLSKNNTSTPRIPEASRSSISKVKIKNKNQYAEDESQLALYTPQDSENPCYCNITLQRTALKIQVDNENEEYVLVDGPVCMPRSMLETKTIPVLVQNISSMVLHSSLMEADPCAGSQSKLNFFQRPSVMEPFENDEKLKSISGQFIPENNDRYYDMTPEREVREEAKIQDLEQIIENHVASDWELENTDDFRDFQLAGKRTVPETSARNYENIKRVKNKPPIRCLASACPFKSAKRKNLITNHRSDSNNKYHYLLVDAATSISDYKVDSPKNDLVSEPDPVATVEDDYRRLLEEDYEEYTEPVGTTETYEKKSEVSLPLLESDQETEPSITDEPKRSDTSLISEEVFETKTEKEVQNFTPFSGLWNDKKGEEEILPPPIVEDEERPPELIKQRPSILTSGRSLFPRSTEAGHEGPKVRYSLVYDEPILPNMQHLAAISQLDNLPEPPKPEEIIENVGAVNPPKQPAAEENKAAINGKMKEFRTVDDEDAANRRFHISNEDKFEIRRVSLLETEVHESEEKTKEKAKTICCGFCSVTKKAANLSSDF